MQQPPLQSLSCPWQSIQQQMQQQNAATADFDLKVWSAGVLPPSASVERVPAIFSCWASARLNKPSPKPPTVGLSVNHSTGSLLYRSNDVVVYSVTMQWCCPRLRPSSLLRQFPICARATSFSWCFRRSCLANFILHTCYKFLLQRHSICLATSTS